MTVTARPRFGAGGGVVRYVLAAVVLGFAVMWVYVLFLADRTPRSKLEDRSVAEAAEALCAPVKAALNALPSGATAKTPQERAVILDQANELVADLARQLAELRADNAEDNLFLDQWREDWGSYVASRYRYADILRQGRDEQFLVQSVDGAPITLRMDGFARLNRMDSCQVPLDV